MSTQKQETPEKSHKEWIVLIIIPLFVLGGLYTEFFSIYEQWIASPAKYLVSISSTLDKYGNLPASDRQILIQKNVTASLAKKAFEVAKNNLDDQTIRAIPLILLVALFPLKIMGLILKSGKKGEERNNDTQSRNAMNSSKKEVEKILPSEKPNIIDLSTTQIGFFKDFNNTVLTVDGLIITIVGGFLISSGIQNFIVVYGFIILITSIIASFIAYSSLISSIVKEKDKEIMASSMGMTYFYLSSHYGFWFLLLGLVTIIAGLV